MDVNLLSTMLVSTIACGNSDLAEYLNKLAPVIIKRHGYCSDEMFYISAQLEILDHAMMFARSYVDFSDARGTSRSKQISRYKSESESKAQATTQNHSCGFSDASSFNQFLRESFDRSRSKSTTDSNSDGFSNSNTYDRSLQQASGISQVWDTARSTSDGEGEGQHEEQSSSVGASYSKTDNEQPDGTVNNIDPGNAALVNLAGQLADIFDIWWSVESAGTYEWDIEGSNDFEFNYDNFRNPGVTGINPDDFITDTIDNDYSNPGAQSITGENIPDLACCCDDVFFRSWLVDCDELGLINQCHWDNEDVYPTKGRRYSVDYNLNVDFQVLKKGLAANISWGRAESYNQSHVVTKACTGSYSQSDTTNFYNQVDVSRAHGETLTEDQSSTQRDYHVRSESERTAHSRTDAGSAATGDAESESESGAERQAHSESHGASQGTNWSKSRARGNSVSTAASKAESIAKNLSDIFEHLSKLYDILFEQREQYRIRFRARQGAAIGLINECKTAIPADPVTQAMLRSLNSCWEKKVCGELC